MLRYFMEQARLYHKGRSAAFSMEEFVLLEVGTPLLNLIFYCTIASYSFNTTDLSSWVIGNSLLLCTNICIFRLGSIFIAERYFGRLRSILVSPTSRISLVLSSGVYPAMFAFLTSVLGFLVGSLIFKLDFTGMPIALLLITICIAMLSATGFGLFVSTFGLITDSMHLWLNIINYVLLIFTGAQFPTTRLPLVGQFIAELLPLTKAIRAVDYLSRSEYKQYIIVLLQELFTGVCYVVLALIVFRVVEGRAKKIGTFDLF